MTTIPARLATLAQRSSSPQESRKRVVRLYREWYRSAPEICAIYALPVSPDYVRHAIRQRFEQNRHVLDQRVIDTLLLKGLQEYQETMNSWKQYDHVMGILLTDINKPQKTFLQKFYEGKDEQAVIPAATGV
ncbi:NdufA6 NADH-ubiquinone oxidoreductase 14.8 kDa subunit [Gymnopilus junonius]|uniref:NdufA6 NADH-ubiquinone oxidoreductase 14.8 kDa subunit n=1 Tax=Gymnopilus junonius TaxID=109634 RepID=A0A9P5NN64_GYMJU|nr:NdufA6 NADH-ubiquinone oxidoreductase 14.8 kDa subunit [Gymnopilus junonius]